MAICLTAGSVSSSAFASASVIAWETESETAFVSGVLVLLAASVAVPQ